MERNITLLPGLSETLGRSGHILDACRNRKWWWTGTWNYPTFHRSGLSGHLPPLVDERNIFFWRRAKSESQERPRPTPRKMFSIRRLRVSANSLKPMKRFVAYLQDHSSNGEKLHPQSVGHNCQLITLVQVQQLWTVICQLTKSFIRDRCLETVWPR